MSSLLGTQSWIYRFIIYESVGLLIAFFLNNEALHARFLSMKGVAMKKLHPNTWSMLNCVVNFAVLVFTAAMFLK